VTEPHERWQDDLVTYALGALEGAEAGELERHLRSCDRCQARLRWLRPAIETLPASVEQIEPPAELRERLMATARAEAAEAEAATARQRRPGPPRIARLRRFALSPVGAATAVVVIGAGAVGYAIGGGGGSGATTVAASGDSTIVRHGDSATLTVRHLPALGPRHVYEVWLKRGVRLEPSSLFVLQRDGTATVRVPRDVSGADAILVSSEPEGGSDRPSSAPVLDAPLD
jgi:anti-sigma factor RsiW